MGREVNNYRNEKQGKVNTETFNYKFKKEQMEYFYQWNIAKLFDIRKVIYFYKKKYTYIPKEILISRYFSFYSLYEKSKNCLSVELILKN